MTLSEQLLSDLPVFFNTDEFSQTVTYAGSSIDAVVSFNKNLDDAGQSPMATGLIRVKASDVANPDYRDAVIISGVTWRVRRIESGDGNTWQLEVYRDERPGVWS